MSVESKVIRDNEVRQFLKDFGSSRKETAKEAALLKEIADLNKSVLDLFFQSEHQSTQIKELTRSIHHLESKLVSKPLSYDKPQNDPKTPPPSPPLGGIEKSVLPVTSEQESSGGVILKAIRSIENEFWGGSTDLRDVGILTIALNHIYKDVYRLPITMY